MNVYIQAYLCCRAAHVSACERNVGSKTREGWKRGHQRTESNSHVEPVDVVALVCIVIFLFSFLLDKWG
jgi:hypothetical protein